jgi:hypothetical protein
MEVQARRTRGPWRAAGGEDPAALAQHIDFLNAVPTDAPDVLGRLDEAAFSLYEALSNLTDAPVFSWGSLDRAPAGAPSLPPVSPGSAFMDRLIRAAWREMRGRPATPERLPHPPSASLPAVRHAPIEIAECAFWVMVAVLRWARTTLVPRGRPPRWLLDTAINTLHDWRLFPERRAARRWSAAGIAYPDPLGMGRQRFQLHLAFGDSPVRAPRERRRRDHDAANMAAAGWRQARERRQRKLPADLWPLLVRYQTDRTVTVASLAREARVDRKAMDRGLKRAALALGIRRLRRSTDG